MSNNIVHFDSIKAWDFLSRNQGSVLVDVRTSAEWDFVGVPDLSSLKKEVTFISWVKYPEMSFNTDFISEFEKTFQDKDATYLFLCRSGGRSAAAGEKIKDLGYANCINIIDGFEGEVSQTLMQRNLVNGWKFNQLPWRQS